MRKKGYLFLLSLIKSTMAIVLIVYFFQQIALEDLINLPVPIVIAGIVYILCQLISRKISPAKRWWDWVYYVGLVFIMIPASFANIDWFAVARVLAQIGALILFLPILADVYFLIKN